MCSLVAAVAAAAAAAVAVGVVSEAATAFADEKIENGFPVAEAEFFLLVDTEKKADLV